MPERDAERELEKQRESGLKHQPGEAGRPAARETPSASRGERRGHRQTDAGPDDQDVAREGQERDAASERERREPSEEERRTRSDEVDEASEDSFPASDPPSYTGGTAG